MFYSPTDLVLLCLGGFKFKIGKTAFSNLSRKTAFRWDELKRQGGRSVLHYAGEDNDTIDLDGTIFPELSKKSGINAFEDMRSEAVKGKPLVLVDAQGNNHGKWVITSIEKGETSFQASGVPRKIDFKVSLRAYE